MLTSRAQSWLRRPCASARSCHWPPPEAWRRRLEGFATGIVLGPAKKVWARHHGLFIFLVFGGTLCAEGGESRRRGIWVSQGEDRASGEGGSNLLRQHSAIKLCFQESRGEEGQSGGREQDNQAVGISTTWCPLEIGRRQPPLICLDQRGLEFPPVPRPLA